MDDFSGTIFAECEELSKKQPSFTIPAIPNGNQYSTWGAKVSLHYLIRIMSRSVRPELGSVFTRSCIDGGERALR